MKTKLAPLLMLLTSCSSQEEETLNSSNSPQETDITEISLQEINGSMKACTTKDGKSLNSLRAYYSLFSEEQIVITENYKNNQEGHCVPEYTLSFHSQENIVNIKKASLSYQEKTKLPVPGASSFSLFYKTKTAEKTISAIDLQEITTLQEKFLSQNDTQSIIFEKKVFNKDCTFADNSGEYGTFEKYSYDIKNKTLKKEYSEHKENLCEKKEINLSLSEETQKILLAYLGKIPLQEYVPQDPVTGGKRYILTLKNNNKTISYTTEELLKKTPQASFSLHEEAFQKIITELQKINP